MSDLAPSQTKPPPRLGRRSAGRAGVVICALFALMAVSWTWLEPQTPTTLLVAALLIGAGVSLGLLVANRRAAQAAQAAAPPPPSAVPFTEALERLPDPFLIVRGGEAGDMSDRRIVFANAAARAMPRSPREGALLVNSFRRPEVLEVVDEALFGRVGNSVLLEDGVSQTRFWQVYATPLDPIGEGRSPEVYALLLLRDEPDFQVLMVRRHHEIDFAGGALVFPGGKVEAEDRVGADAHSELDADDYAARVAAVREAFEESGVLLAVDASGAQRGPGGDITRARARMVEGEPFADVLRSLELKPAVSALGPFARWIAPAVAPKRYDTWFYVAATPPDHLAACDGSETVDAEWIAPSEALRFGETGERTVIFPTRMNLRRLAESGSTAEAIAAAKARPKVTVEPQIEMRPDGRYLVLPEAMGYGAVEEPFFAM